MIAGDTREREADAVYVAQGQKGSLQTFENKQDGAVSVGVCDVTLTLRLPMDHRLLYNSVLSRIEDEGWQLGV